MELETVKTVALWSIITVAVIGVVMAVIIRKIVGKIISLVVAAILVFVGWQQRGKVIDYASEVRGKACTSSSAALDGATPQNATSFLGITISMPQGWCY
ncbi:hypothetical protein EH165_14060 [Nakamurella antarctica]|uniref:Uncharacterized protein n=1 Tax=Nakamurella antarctica TaxID=1902245 RepID=A0A3G8ZYJ2_9ACTN|nr:hypothetical protein [Nakamurella antarctica]AZI59096.1 hypothetical protein EH165_14060 [Nakamurella antarctica]